MRAKFAVCLAMITTARMSVRKLIHDTIERLGDRRSCKNQDGSQQLERGKCQDPHSPSSLGTRTAAARKVAAAVGDDEEGGAVH